MVYRYFSWLVACGIVVAPGATFSAEAGIQAWLEQDSQGPQLKITPYCRSIYDTPVRYRLTSIKRGTSGTSRSSQAGRVKLTAGKDEALAHLNLGIQEQDRYTLELDVFENNQLVAQDRLTFPATPAETK